MRSPNKKLSAILPGMSLLVVGALLLATAAFLTEPWRVAWTVLVGLATLILLVGTINLFERWTDARGFWDD
jgi:hypothetical protein